MHFYFVELIVNAWQVCRQRKVKHGWTYLWSGGIHSLFTSIPQFIISQELIYIATVCSLTSLLHEALKQRWDILKWIKAGLFFLQRWLAAGQDDYKDTIRASWSAHRQHDWLQPINPFAPSVQTSQFPSLQCKLSCQDAPRAMIYMPALWEGAHTHTCKRVLPFAFGFGSYLGIF